MNFRRDLSAPPRWCLAGLGMLFLLAGYTPGFAHDDASPPALPASAHVFPKRLYIANDDHTDYMWSATDVQYRTILPSMLDSYLDLIDATASNPADARAKFNCDGALWVYEYERTHTPQQFTRLMDHVRAGTITVPLNFCIQLYGAMPAEAVLRSFYWAGELERREGVRLPLVVPMENQTLPGGVASLWAGAGARYAWKGICNCATQVDATLRPREIYRFTGPDGQGVLLKWNSIAGFSNASIGGYAEAYDPAGVVQLLDADPTFLSRWPYDVAAAFGYGQDRVQSYTTGFEDASLQLSNATRRVIVSNEVDFFQDFAATYPDSLLSISGSFGNEWDLLTASMGAATGEFRRALERLRTAEGLAAIASLFDSSFMEGREVKRDSANIACGLFFEHNWSPGAAATSSERAAWERRMLGALSGYADTLRSDAMTTVASQVVQPGGSDRYLVFNPLSWTRTDIADLDPATASPRHVVDVASGLELPSQEVTVNGKPRLRVLVSGVPSVGYRVVEVRPGTGTTFSPSATVTLPAMDNGLYRVTLGTRGQITSVLDHKDADRELVSAGGALNDFGAGAGVVTLLATGPVSTTLRVVAGGSPPHEVNVTLYAGVDRIDVDDLITANFTDEEGYTSSFALPGMTMRHEEIGMIARVAQASAGGDYADTDARTDWLSFNHFVDLSQSGRGVTLSNADSPFFSAGGSTITSLDASTPSVHAVAGMQLTAIGGGINGQGGDTSFPNHFSYRTHGPWDPAAAMRFALEHQNPFATARVTGVPNGSLPGDQWSLLTIDSPDVLLWALKPAEEGISHGLIARVWNMAEAPRSMTLALPTTSLASAIHTTHIETDLEPRPVAGGVLSETLQRQEMRTWRLMPQSIVGVNPTAPAGSQFLGLDPNPVRIGDRLEVRLRLAMPGRVRVDLYDVRGARVAGLADVVQSAGMHATELQVPRAAGLSSGVYLVRVRVPGLDRSRRVVLIR